MKSNRNVHRTQTNEYYASKQRHTAFILFLFVLITVLAWPDLAGKPHGANQKALQSAAQSARQPAPNSGKTAGPPAKPDANPKQTQPAGDESAPNVPPAQQALSKRLVEYHIHVTLNAPQHLLIGQESMTWTNPGYFAVQDMYIHLYPNAFQSKKSTFMLESGGRLRNDRMKEGSFGNMQIQSAMTENGYDLLQGMKFVHPDDANTADHTLAWFRLPHPVEPGKSITVNFKFAVKLPYTFARMGYAGNFVMAGQWFPKAAVYEPAGTRNRQGEGWNIHEYHGNSEFYSDFGIYSVEINVPGNDTVAATGSPTKPPVSKNGRKIYQFYADDVHDFAWAASPDFIYASEPFSAEHVPGVKIKLYLDPTQKKLEQRYFTTAKKALADYSQWYGEYPYHTLSIVIPPQGGNGAGGMEYPTLITGWSAESANPDLELERVIVHEIGHQYWYGMIATNEFEEAWLDEGFTSYAEDKVMLKEFGVKPNLPVEASYITSPEPLKWNAWKYGSHSEYADNVYIRAKLVLSAIEERIGTRTMNRVLHQYFEQWKFKHPSTEDFQQVLEQVTHRSWKNFFDQFVYGGSMVDYAVENIDTHPGIRGGKKYYENIVKFARKGGYDQPVPLLFHFADGREISKNWDGETATVEYKLPGPSPLQWVAVDPHFTLLLENHHMNNFRKATVSTDQKIRWIVGIEALIKAVIGQIVW